MENGKWKMEYLYRNGTRKCFRSSGKMKGRYRNENLTPDFDKLVTNCLEVHWFTFGFPFRLTASFDTVSTFDGSWMRFIRDLIGRNESLP